MSMGTLEAFFFLQWWTTRDFFELWIYWGIIESFEYSAEGCSSRDSIEWISQFNKYSENERDFLELRIPETSPLPEWRVEKLKWTFSRVIELLSSRSYFLTFIENDKNSHQLSASHHEWSETYVLTVSNSETRAVTKSRVKMRMKNSLEFFFYLNNISATLPVELRKTNSEYFLCFQFSRLSKHIFVGRYFSGELRDGWVFFGSQQASKQCA